ncbi:MAG: NAD(P)-dependent oxidoreductase [Armatimonadota bacterium]
MKIGVVGTGIMGFALARKLLEEGHEVTVWNRTYLHAAPFLVVGGSVARTLEEVVESAEVVFTSLKDDAALRDVVVNQGGLLDTLPTSSVHCDTSTISPALARELAALYEEAGKLFVHAPVLGSRNQIAGGTLLIFAAGSQSAIDILQPVFDVISERLWIFPPGDEAANLKLSCNMLIASMICSFSQSLTFAAKMGVCPELFVDVIAASALSSPMYSSKGKQILDRNWAANFFVDNIIKDIRLAMDAGAAEGVQLPLLANVLQYFAAATDTGYGKEDYSAVSKIFEGLAGVDLAKQG